MLNCEGIYSSKILEAFCNTNENFKASFEITEPYIISIKTDLSRDEVCTNKTMLSSREKYNWI